MSTTGPTPLAAFDRTTLSVRPGPWLAPVLGRVFGILAAHADLPVDRVADAQALGLAVADWADRDAVGERLAIALEARPGVLRVRVGPISDGCGLGSPRPAGQPDAGAVIEQLADEIATTRASAGGEYLLLNLIAR
jgi:hypothetical protein